MFGGMCHPEYGGSSAHMSTNGPPSAGPPGPAHNGAVPSMAAAAATHLHHHHHHHHHNPSSFISSGGDIHGGGGTQYGGASNGSSGRRTGDDTDLQPSNNSSSSQLGFSNSSTMDPLRGSNGGGSITPPESNSPSHQPTTKYEQGSPSPSGIVSDNGLQYANLDGGGAGEDDPNSGGSYLSYHQHQAQLSHHQNYGGYDHLGSTQGSSTPMPATDNTTGTSTGGSPNTGSTAVAAAAAAAAGLSSHSFTAYLENAAAAGMNMTAAAYGHPSYLYSNPHPAAAAAAVAAGGNHHPSACNSMTGKMRAGGHPHSEFYGHIPKPASNVPTYKWMQVKRNVPKPSKYLWCCI